MIKIKKWNDRIRELREDLPQKKNQTEIAKALNMTQRKLSYIERGETEPSIDDMIKICKYYNVSLDYIVGLTNVPKTIDGEPYNVKNMTQINGNNNNIKIENKWGKNEKNK